MTYSQVQAALPIKFNAVIPLPAAGEAWPNISHPPGSKSCTTALDPLVGVQVTVNVFADLSNADLMAIREKIIQQPSKMVN